MSICLGCGQALVAVLFDRRTSSTLLSLANELLSGENRYSHRSSVHLSRHLSRLRDSGAGIFLVKCRQIYLPRELLFRQSTERVRLSFDPRESRAKRLQQSGGKMHYGERVAVSQLPRAPKTFLSGHQPRRLKARCKMSVSPGQANSSNSSHSRLRGPKAFRVAHFRCCDAQPCRGEPATAIHGSLLIYRPISCPKPNPSVPSAWPTIIEVLQGTDCNLQAPRRDFAGKISEPLCSERSEPAPGISFVELICHMGESSIDVVCIEPIDARNKRIVMSSGRQFSVEFRLQAKCDLGAALERPYEQFADPRACRPCRSRL
ncbi:hypothetical protein VTK26DRAFT_4412 [Humicola hyalothermophila]